MPRTRTVFVCTECGGEATRWMGQCPHCGVWNTLVEETVRRAPRSTPKREERSASWQRPIPLGSVQGNDRPRWRTGLSELDFVLGGGIVPGSLVLLGGEPGIGKSTLLLQVSARLAAAGHPVLYVSGEESAHQVKLRAERLSEAADAVQILAETSAEAVLDRVCEAEPDVLVVDSIQTLYTDRVESAPGSVAQVRDVAALLQSVAKDREMATFLVGHVTKGGAIAGPRTLEHIVDVVMYFEPSPDLDHRLVRGTKNRFGAADEIALFRMGPAGLVPVDNASGLFLRGRQAQVSGSAVTAVLEGSRPVLVEVQALATDSVYGAPQRVATGFDSRRLAVLLAVLERRAGLRVSGSDVFLNVVGGLRLSETAADLAVVVAITSAVRDVAVDSKALFLGEVGLGGEVRPVGQLERRLVEAVRLGFERVYLKPAGGARVDGSVGSVTMRPVRDIGELLDAAFP